MITTQQNLKNNNWTPKLCTYNKYAGTLSFNNFQPSRNNNHFVHIMYGNLLDAKQYSIWCHEYNKMSFLKTYNCCETKKTNIGARNVYMATHALI